MLRQPKAELHRPAPIRGTDRSTGSPCHRQPRPSTSDFNGNGIPDVVAVPGGARYVEFVNGTGGPLFNRSEIQTNGCPVALTEGHTAFSRTLALHRGEQKSVDAELHVTSQRTASWVMLGVGAGGVVASGVLGYIALKRESDAKALRDADSSQGNLPPAELDRYNSLRQSRDNFRLASVIAFSAGAGVAAVGLVLRAFDGPKAPLPPVEQTTPGAPKRAPEAPAFEVSAAPLWRPGYVGAGASGRF